MFFNRFFKRTVFKSEPPPTMSNGAEEAMLRALEPVSFKPSAPLFMMSNSAEEAMLRALEPVSFKPSAPLFMMSNSAEEAMLRALEPVSIKPSAPLFMMSNSAEEAMLLALECPVCLEPSAPLFMCVNGHSICSDCREDLLRCPICRVPGKPASRSIALDIISEQVLSQACENKPHGCKVMRRTAESLKMHEDDCVFYSYSCATMLGFSGCPFLGRLLELHEHVKNDHFIYIQTLGSELKMIFNRDSHNCVSILKCVDGPEYFIHFVRYVSPQKLLYCYMHYIGPKKNANKFLIRMKLTSGDKNSMVIQCFKQPLALCEAYENNKNTITIGQEYFDSEPDGTPQIFCTVGPIVNI